MKIQFIIALLLLSTTTTTRASFINDFLTGASFLWPKGKDVGSVDIHKKLAHANFELPVESEQFIKEGLEIINAPKDGIDLCSHRVLMTLKKNCNQLSLDEISKLAVMLTNCQLEVEGRSTYPCKPEMTLAQCTIGFDNHLHKLYSIMNHRALAICSALKHDQFRASTEMAVNNLMKLAASQSKATHESLENQRRINEMGIQNIQEYKENHEKIKEAQSQSSDYINTAKEQLLEINSDLQRLFEINQLAEQKTMQIEKMANEIATQLEDTNLKIREQSTEALQIMERTKNVMSLISAFLYTIELAFEKIKSILEEIGFSNVTQEFFTSLVINIFYFTCCMIFIIFMNMQRMCKRILMSLFAFNTIALYFDSDIPLLGINILVWTSYACYHFFARVKELIFSFVKKSLRFLRFRKEDDSNDDNDEDDDERRNKSPSRARSKTPFVKTSNQQQKDKNATKDKNSNKKNEDDEDSEIADLCEKEIQKLEAKILSTPIRSEAPVNIQNRAATPTLLRVMSTEIPNMNRSNTPFIPGMSGRIQCQAMTNKGTQCRNAALLGYAKCKVHNYD